MEPHARYMSLVGSWLLAVLALTSLGCRDSSTTTGPTADGPPDATRRTVAVRIVGTLDQDAEFQRFLANLKAAASKRDSAAVHDTIAGSFSIRRDFGGLFDPEASAVENFSRVYMFDDAKLRPEYRGSGWREFDRDLAGPFSDEGALACGPPRITIEPDFSDETAAEAAGCFYVDGEAVAVYASASASSATVATLDHEVVTVIRPEETSVVEGPRPAFIEVRTSSGGQGFVKSDRIRTCMARRLCFSHEPTKGWQIASVELAGD